MGGLYGCRRIAGGVIHATAKELIAGFNFDLRWEAPREDVEQAFVGNDFHELRKMLHRL